MVFDFNLYSSLLIPSFFHAVLFAALFLYRGHKEGLLSDKLMSAILLIFSLKIAYWMLGFAGWYDSHNAYTSFMFYFPFDGIFFLGPLIYFYFNSITNHEFKFEKSHFLYFIIPIVYLLTYVFKFVVDFGFNYPFLIDETTQFGTKGPMSDINRNDLTLLLGFISFFYYSFIVLKEFKNYHKYLENNFTNTDVIDLSWLRKILYLIVIGVILFLILNVISNNYSGNIYVLEWFGYFFLGLTVYYISISAYQYTINRTQRLEYNIVNNISESILLVTEELPIEIKKSIPKKELEKYKEKILQQIENKQLYLNPEIALNDLAKLIDSNTSTISKVINEGFDLNFNDFINAYRVNYVKDKIKSGEAKDKTLLSLAFESGFNSKATFNRAFKKHTGQSPKEFMIL